MSAERSRQPALDRDGLDGMLWEPKVAAPTPAPVPPAPARVAAPVARAPAPDPLDVTSAYTEVNPVQPPAPHADLDASDATPARSAPWMVLGLAAAALLGVGLWVGGVLGSPNPTPAPSTDQVASSADPSAPSATPGPAAATAPSTTSDAATAATSASEGTATPAVSDAAPSERSAGPAAAAPAPVPSTPAPASEPPAPEPAHAPLVISFTFDDVQPGAFEVPTWLTRCARVEVVGHTCDLGTDETNRVIGQARADAVRDRLAQAGLAPDRLVTRSAGSAEPAEPNTTRDGRRANRRVTVNCAATGRE